MTRRGRGSTGPGRPAPIAAPGYPSPGPVGVLPDGALVVAFHGDDDRHRTFPVGRLPLPGWHQVLAAAVAQHTGPAGGRRTLSSAVSCWGSVVRVVRFLASLPDAPGVAGQLTVAHLEAFGAPRPSGSPATAAGDVETVCTLIKATCLREAVTAEVLDYARRRRHASDRRRIAAEAAPASGPGAASRRAPATGFSDGELARVLAALRSDAAGVRDRIRAGEDLLRRLQTDPSSLDDPERERAQRLAGMAATGQVPIPARAGANPFTPGRQDLAGELFLTVRDIPALIMLAVALTERNGETVKELPAAHRVLDGRAVEVVIAKRRRGAGRWFETVTWEIGPPGRELHTPGGLYLLLLELTARSRALCRSPLLWCVWRNASGPHLDVPGEHHAVFGGTLRSGSIRPSDWAAQRSRPLLADPAPARQAAAGAGGPAEGTPVALTVSFHRIRTSMEVRRTKRMGGHLPSAAKSNTVPVLFRNYLSGDPVITDWAQEVLGEALVDAERGALTAHERLMSAGGGGPRVLPDLVEAPAAGGCAGPGCGHAPEAGWAACVDHDRHPATGQPCGQSLLRCFHCANALITRDHLPALVTLLDALARRRQEVPSHDWWTRYGPAWAAIDRDVLPRFTPAELQAARALEPGEVLLDLIENPWELP